MTKKSKAKKLLSIEEQIKELQERKIKMEKNLYLSIGKSVVSEWGTMDEDELIATIKQLREKAIQTIKELDKDKQSENIPVDISSE